MAEAATISFHCQGCGRAFTVPSTFAGRKARCKNCGGEIVVPNLIVANAPSPAVQVTPSSPAAATVAPRLSPRARRLLADAEQMRKAFSKFERIRLKSATGEPPDTYQMEYLVDSLEPGKSAQKPLPRGVHLVEIRLTGDYPRTKPLCRMLTPVFHPNIDPATICVGDHWTAGEHLVDLVIRIGEMLAYQAYNIKSPLDAEAAMWADLNQGRLPTDSRSMHPPEA